MRKIVYILLLSLLLTACSSSKDQVYSDRDTSKLEQVLKEQDKIAGYQSVIDNNDVVVAIDIPRFKRFQKVKIEDEVKKAIEKEFPDKEVIVTGDIKIKWEIEKIVEKKKKNDELKKSISDIKSLSKEET
ncbi:YhcN/YlaJ family sporulation lipoprotein [uncultured Psychrobacillus sp.]|uniref:YhcN/YlaJ family sporulation lipoprotein n=1 Tax=uncultured Psychrobacillus sp. TaxID=1551585 RepID=UPI00261AD831|nr:YhcN/YlaJ family sporulation lipoprotein [uncultured Psychrobacillus sp.]